jgi:hypothetical protein
MPDACMLLPRWRCSTHHLPGWPARRWLVPLSVTAPLRAAPAAALQGTKLAPACEAAGLQSFPTWVIGGQVLEGEQTFEQLEAALAKVQPAAP